jgi:peptide-methionine (S)-S-oxide reductase
MAEAVLAGGCFWGVEAVFEHVRGVQSVTSGFARYGDPVAVEAVRIVYDPSVVEYRQLLEVFFAVAHDPASRDRQGPDIGPEYRAAVLYQSPAERETARSLMAELAKAGRFTRPIVTELRQLSAFTVAAPLHQDYGFKHPDDAYIVRNDAPKLVHLKESFPALYQERRSP